METKAWMEAEDWGVMEVEDWGVMEVEDWGVMETEAWRVMEAEVWEVTEAWDAARIAEAWGMPEVRDVVSLWKRFINEGSFNNHNLYNLRHVYVPNEDAALMLGQYPEIYHQRRRESVGCRG